MWLTTRAINRELWGMARMAGPPDWWGELITIPNVADPKRLPHKICASFEVPQVRCKALGDSKDYTMPPVPKCIQRERFLLVPNLPSTLSGLPPEVIMEDPGLCPNPSVLDWEDQHDGPWWVMPFGNVCAWVEAGYETIHDLQWSQHLQRPDLQNIRS